MPRLWPVRAGDPDRVRVVGVDRHAADVLSLLDADGEPIQPALRTAAGWFLAPKDAGTNTWWKMQLRIVDDNSAIFILLLPPRLRIDTNSLNA